MKYSAEYKIKQILVKYNFLYNCYSVNSCFDITDYSEEAEFISRRLTMLKPTRENIEVSFHLFFSWYSNSYYRTLYKVNKKFNIKVSNTIKIKTQCDWDNVISKIINDIVKVYSLPTKIYELFLGKQYTEEFMDNFYFRYLPGKIDKLQNLLDKHSDEYIKWKESERNNHAFHCSN